MSSRQSHIAFFGGYDVPVINITAFCETADFVTPAKACALPPFAILLHALGRASLDIPQFRSRLREGVLETIERLTLSYTILGAQDDLNFSSLPYEADIDRFVGGYLKDRAEARAATDLRLVSMEHRAYLFVTCLPWLSFTSIQHPIGDLRDCSIPLVAAGRFERRGARLRFPLAVQAHHGLVDGLHIARYIARVSELLTEARESLKRRTSRS